MEWPPDGAVARRWHPASEVSRQDAKTSADALAPCQRRM